MNVLNKKEIYFEVVENVMTVCENSFQQSINNPFLYL